MKILALNGSHNNDGNTAFLLKTILSYFKEEDTEIINIHEAITDAKNPFCISCSTPCNGNCYIGTKLEYALNKVSEADFVIFGSPVYFGSMSAQLKAFFDKTRAMRAEKKWLNKPVAAVSVGATKYGGQERTIEAIHSCALVSGMHIIGNGCENSMGHFGVSAQRPSNEDQYAISQCKNLAIAIKKHIKYFCFFQY